MLKQRTGIKPHSNMEGKYLNHPRRPKRELLLGGAGLWGRHGLWGGAWVAGGGMGAGV